MIKKLLAMVVWGVATGVFTAAQAHGDAQPKHGGVVQKASDLSFELVSQADGAAIYIEDHDKPMAVVGVSGKLTVLSGADKFEADLKPVGNKLEAKGVKLVSGSKAVASVTTADKKTITVRFAIK